MKVEIIAELAQGFEGRPEQARLLLRAAARAGADAAKFQLVYADELATPDYKYYEFFKSLEMGDEVWDSLARYAAELGIELHVDIFGALSLALAERIGVGAIKLHGTDLANRGLLTAVARSTARKVFLGAGGSYASELDEAISILAAKPVVFLVGFQGYPTPLGANQILRVRVLIERLHGKYPHVQIGFADHASPESLLRYALATTAVGAGATVIEKHLTLGRGMKLEDHESALNPDEFLEFTEIVRACAEAMGSVVLAEDFGMNTAEQEYRTMIRRHVVARRDIATGSVLTADDLVLKRTSATDAVTNLHTVYGRVLRRHLVENSPLLSTDVD